MAARFWVGGAGNWSDAGLAHWSLTTGGSAGQAVPTNADDVTFDGNSGAVTVTLDTAVNKVAKTLTVNGFTGTLTFNVQLAVSGSITFTTTGFSFAGATTNKLRMIAAGTWTTNGKTVAQDVEIGGTTTFTCTLAGALTTSGDLTLTNTTSTIFSGAFNITAANLTISGSQTLTLTGHLIISTLTTLSDANVLNTSTSKELQTASLTCSGAMTGTAVVRFTGGGTWTGASATANSVSVDGDTTLSGTVLYSQSGTPTLTLNGGGLLTGTLSIASSCTIVGHATKGIASLTITGAITLTINTNALLITVGLFCPNANVTFGGSAGFTALGWSNATIAASSKTYTLTQGNTYAVTGSISSGDGLQLAGASASLLVTVTSSHASNKVVLTLGLTCAQASLFVSYTRVDASLGQTILARSGTVTTCFNIDTIMIGGRVRLPAGGETVAVAGVTYDNAGAILGSCTVILLRENGDDSVVYWGETVSNASTGAYSFSTFPGDYRVIAYKADTPDVFDVTDVVAAA